MKHLLFIILFGGAFYKKADGQFMTNTDFYYRNKELCDSINKLKTISYMRNDSLFGLTIYPHDNPIVWDSIYAYRFNFFYKKNQPDSIANTGYATVYSRNKARDSVVALLPPARSFNNAASPTIQTVAAAANGNQLSATRDAFVSYSATIVSTATISGNASGYIVLEICPTNSSTAGNWIEIARIANGAAVSLAVVLQAVTTGGSTVTGIVPAGYYRRLRSITVAGSPSFTLNSGQEVLE